MSLARLVITAVTVEGRTESAVARHYGVTPLLGTHPGQTVPRRGRGGCSLGCSHSRPGKQLGARGYRCSIMRPGDMSYTDATLPPAFEGASR
jgi:hypothetical protein